MTGIKKQRELLSILKTEIRETKQKLADIDKQVEALDERRTNDKDDTDNAVMDAERINKLKIRIKETVKKMEKYKADSENALRLMETEIEYLVVEMEERKPQLARMGLDIIPVATNLEQTETELVSLKSNLKEKSSKFQEVETELSLSSTQLSHLKDRITSLSNLPLAISNKVEEDIFTSTPPIVPALVVSTVLNMMTGVTLLSKFLMATTSTTNNLARVDRPE